LGKHKPGLAPNRRLQRTALCAREIAAILKPRIKPKAFAIYRGAAAEAQGVGWHFRLVCCIVCRSATPSRQAPSPAERHRPCPPNLTVVAPGSIACETSSSMPSRLEWRRGRSISHLEWRRGMLISRVECPRTCPASQNLSASCSLVCGTPLRMSTQ